MHAYYKVNSDPPGHNCDDSLQTGPHTVVVSCTEGTRIANTHTRIYSITCTIHYIPYTLQVVELRLVFFAFIIQEAVFARLKLVYCLTGNWNMYARVYYLTSKAVQNVEMQP